MGVETEYKYLVKNNLYKEDYLSKVEICQGYLSRDPERTVRVRIKDRQGYITIKGKTQGASRLEFEYSIPLADAVELLKLCKTPVIKKVRYRVEYDGMIWEVDEFLSPRQGLVLAEIELDHPSRSYAIPPFVGENVTGDPQYYNSML